MKVFDLPLIRAKIEELRFATEQPGFWNGNDAQNVSKELSRLQGQVDMLVDTQKEIEELLKDYPDISRKHFDDAMTGNTCQAKLEDDKWVIVNYHCDVLKALIAGIEARNLSMWEWD